MNGLSDKFDIASRSYNRALRWDDMDTAVAYLPPESVHGFLAEREIGEDVIKIVDYDRVRVQVDQKHAQGFVRVMLHGTNGDFFQSINLNFFSFTFFT